MLATEWAGTASALTRSPPGMVETRSPSSPPTYLASPEAVDHVVRRLSLSYWSRGGRNGVLIRALCSGGLPHEGSPILL
jgi:hypothetical protein